MKKIILGIGAFAFLFTLSISMNSCKKEEAPETIATAQTSSQIKIGPISSQIAIEQTRIFECDPTPDEQYPCNGEKTNCDHAGESCIAMTVVVVGEVAGALARLDLAISTNTVPVFFRNTLDVEILFPGLLLKRKLISDLRNGITTVRRVQLTNKSKNLFTLHNVATGELLK